jgi:glycosyltransferase involved in cell wall biosynthesis
VRVLIDTSYADRGHSGTGVYAERIAAALREGGRVELVEARQRLRLRRGGPARSAANAALDLLWLHFGLPRAARIARADLVHHTLPAHSRRIGVAQVATVQDLAFLRMPERYDRAWARLARRSYAHAVRRCEAIVCPTQATADDLVELLRARRERIVVAPYGPGQAESAPRVDPAGDYLLFVGDVEPRKNLSGLLEAYAAYREAAGRPLPLVLAGAAAAAAGAPGVEGRDAPDARALAEIMRGAVALVHPSLHEGFGFTPLEAMALGVPVVAVSNPGTREVCGDAALLVEPGALAAAIARIAAEPDLRADLARRGAARAAEFSWARAALAHERAYTLAHRAGAAGA